MGVFFVYASIRDLAAFSCTSSRALLTLSFARFCLVHVEHVYMLWDLCLPFDLPLMPLNGDKIEAGEG